MINNNMRVEEYTNDMYPFIKTWWELCGWEPVSKLLLPKTGYVIWNDNEPVCAAWYIKTNAPTAWIEWVIKNPNADNKVVKKGLTMLYDTIESVAKEDGYVLILTMLEHEGLKSFVSDRGWKSTDKKLDAYIKNLGGNL
tara:strand:+ start:10520 stop:10936 length:417 start_codon:yes stop_codon:yes gene_type:complete